MAVLAAPLQRNHVRVGGNPRGPPMLFIHGFGCDQNMWRFIEPTFAGAYETILMDLTGMGASDASQYDRRRHGSLHGHADDIIEVLDALGRKGAILVAHSVSAMTAILVAGKRPDLVGRLILIGPSPRYINEAGYVGGFERTDIEGLLGALDSNYLGWSSQMAPVIMGNPERPELGTELTNSFCRNDPAIAGHFARVTFLSDHRADLAKAKVPTLVLQCSNDAIAPDVVGRYVADHIPGSTFHKLSASGHCPNLSAPAETAAAMQKFLET